MFEWIALIIIISWLSISFTYGYIKSRKKTKTVEEWFVAGRGLGLVILWLSLGANIYSSYTFLGLPGMAARYGIRVFTIVLYGMISYIIGFWFVPLLWRNARERGWLTIADAYQDLYNSRLMGVFAALTGALWSIPYIQLQLQGMGYIIEASSYGYINRELATIAAFIVLAIIVTIGGLVSVTSINALQGAIMLIAVWLLGLLSPLIAFGGYDKMFDILVNANPPPQLKFHVIPEFTDYLFLYTIIFAAPLGFWMWPNRIQNIFGARDEKIVKRNMVLTGIYQISQIPAVMVGLTFIALYFSDQLMLPPNTHIYDKEVTDKAFMLVATKLYNPALVGVIGAGALAASLSTAAAILHACGALFSRNIAPVTEQRKLLLYARIFTMSIAMASLVLAIYMPEVLVSLLLVGYAGIIQLFPEYIIAVKKPGLIDKYVALTASISGMITVFYFKTFKPIPGFYEGFAGLLVNLIILSIMILINKFRR